jgi:hypothetical protein
LWYFNNMHNSCFGRNNLPYSIISESSTQRLEHLSLSQRLVFQDIASQFRSRLLASSFSTSVTLLQVGHLQAVEPPFSFLFFFLPVFTSTSMSVMQPWHTVWPQLVITESPSNCWSNGLDRFPCYDCRVYCSTFYAATRASAAVRTSATSRALSPPVGVGSLR